MSMRQILTNHEHHHITELKDSKLPVEHADLLKKSAKDVDHKTLKKLMIKSQYKDVNEGYYVAHKSSYDPSDQTYDADLPYDQWLDEYADKFIKNFDRIRQAHQQHFHTEMTVRYFVDYFIAMLHTQFVNENHQNRGKLIWVNGYEKEA
ncbi:MAG: hypothetical protein AJITA_00051 [Acetilactobacillus jinshanensis]